MGTSSAHSSIARSALLIVLLTATLPACASGKESTVQWVQGGETVSAFGLGLPVPADDPRAVVSEMRLCRSGVATSTAITRVEFEKTEGLKVTSFSTRTGPVATAQTGGAPGGLSALGFSPGSDIVGAICGENQAVVTDLGIEVVAASGTRPKGTGLSVTYSDGSHQGRLVIPVTVLLCLDLPAGQSCREG